MISDVFPGCDTKIQLLQSTQNIPQPLLSVREELTSIYYQTFTSRLENALLIVA